MKIKHIKVGGIITVLKHKYICLKGDCSQCDIIKLPYRFCEKYECRYMLRKDRNQVMFKKIRKLKRIKK